MTAPNPIDDSLPYDSEMPLGQQDAWHAVVHLVVPRMDKQGTPVTTEADAQDYIAETLRGQFLDWGYVRATDPETGEPVEGSEGMQGPIPITVCEPYVEGTFLQDDEDDEDFDASSIEADPMNAQRKGI